MAEPFDDIDPVESREWQDAVEDVIARDGADRAHYLLDKAVQQARAAGATLPFSATTPYQNTIPTDQQEPFPGDMDMEWRPKENKKMRRDDPPKQRKFKS